MGEVRGGPLLARLPKSWLVFSRPNLPERKSEGYCQNRDQYVEDQCRLAYVRRGGSCCAVDRAIITDQSGANENNPKQANHHQKDD